MISHQLSENNWKANEEHLLPSLQLTTALSVCETDTSQTPKGWSQLFDMKLIIKAVDIVESQES